ncbi:MAG: hypothetical protein ABIW38_05350 [Ferruginibacter sp.]
MKHSILFTGLMIDAKERRYARFPVSKEKMVRKEIQKRLIMLKEKFPAVSGIAGGACGGDIIFHELCMEMNIHSEIYLALPFNEFKNQSVSFAGTNWDDRFDNLTGQLPVHILPISSGTEKNVWELANEWMLKVALQHGGEPITLIALWDGKAGDGGGGTEHMVKIAKNKKATVEIIDINKL